MTSDTSDRRSIPTLNESFPGNLAAQSCPARALAAADTPGRSVCWDGMTSDTSDRRSIPTLNESFREIWLRNLALRGL